MGYTNTDQDRKAYFLLYCQDSSTYFFSREHGRICKKGKVLENENITLHTLLVLSLHWMNAAIQFKLSHYCRILSFGIVLIHPSPLLCPLKENTTEPCSKASSKNLENPWTLLDSLEPSTSQGRCSGSDDWRRICRLHINRYVQVDMAGSLGSHFFTVLLLLLFLIQAVTTITTGFCFVYLTGQRNWHFPF